MAGLPPSLSIPIWFAASLCVIGGFAYYIGYFGELALLVAFLGGGRIGRMEFSSKCG